MPKSHLTIISPWAEKVTDKFGKNRHPDMYLESKMSFLVFALETGRFTQVCIQEGWTLSLRGNVLEPICNHQALSQNNTIFFNSTFNQSGDEKICVEDTKEGSIYYVTQKYY